jgi:CRP-like cAMP-binding protein
MTESSQETPASVVLERTNLCDSLNQHELDELAAVTSQRTLKKGELLCREGEHGASAFVVVSGAIEVFVGRGPDKTVLATLRPYQLLGELSLLEPAARTASASAIEPTVVLELTHERLQELRDVLSSGAFKLIRAISQLICQRIRDINTLIEAELEKTEAGDASTSDAISDGEDDGGKSSGSEDHEVIGIFKRLFKGS